MIYLSYTVEEWKERHPELDILTKDCDNCGKLIIANVPFVMKGYAGFAAHPCVCGKNRSTCSSRVTTTDEMHDMWEEILGGK